MSGTDTGGATIRSTTFWLAYVKHLGGRQSPVLLVQAKVDTPADRRALRWRRTRPRGSTGMTPCPAARRRRAA